MRIVDALKGNFNPHNATMHARPHPLILEPRSDCWVANWSVNVKFLHGQLRVRFKSVRLQHGSITYLAGEPRLLPEKERIGQMKIILQKTVVIVATKIFRQHGMALIAQVKRLCSCVMVSK